MCLTSWGHACFLAGGLRTWLLVLFLGIRRCRVESAPGAVFFPGRVSGPFAMGLRCWTRVFGGGCLWAFYIGSGELADGHLLEIWC